VSLLSVEGLSVGYAAPRGLVRAVDGLSLEVAGPGEAVGIIGESGSGKSSLALALMRLLPRNATVSAGRVLFRDQDIGIMSDDEYRRSVRWSGISMVTQGAQHALNPVIAVGDQVAERLKADGAKPTDVRARVDELLGRVGLPAGTSKRYPHELSGGMRQRVMIAMALTHDPPLVILDEPTSALDVSVQAQIMNLLKELKWERGISMLFITHDLALASDLCDRIVVVYAGQVREDGPADGVLTAPRDPYTRALLSSLPLLHGDGLPTALAGSPPDPVEPVAGCRFAARCPVVFQKCAEPPPLVEVAPGHWARCWREVPA
jgi:oligopeptide/dipeptide ABC transporter ATP-binding protein